MAQVDIGFDTRNYLWFLNFWSNTRWMRGSVYVHDGKIILDKVMLDTYAWNDITNDKTSHGRFRFYDNVKIDMPISEPPLCDYIKLTGKSDKLAFTKYEVKEAILKYKRATMEWEIKIGDTKLYTKDIKGMISGRIDDKPRLFIATDVTILHSWLVTLINCPLEIKD